LKFADAYQFYRILALRVAESFSRCHQDAEDATQDAFAQLWRRVTSLRNASTVSPSAGSYICKAVKHTALSVSQRRRREQQVLERVWQQQHVAAKQLLITSLDSGAGLVSQELAAMLRAALEDLPPRRRMILELRYGQCKKVREIAEELRIKEGTVKASIHQGVRALRIRIQRQKR